MGEWVGGGEMSSTRFCLVKKKLKYEELRTRMIHINHTLANPVAQVSDALNDSVI